LEIIKSSIGGLKAQNLIFRIRSHRTHPRFVFHSARQRDGDLWFVPTQLVLTHSLLTYSITHSLAHSLAHGKKRVGRFDGEEFKLPHSREHVCCYSQGCRKTKAFLTLCYLNNLKAQTQVTLLLHPSLISLSTHPSIPYLARPLPRCPTYLSVGHHSPHTAHTHTTTTMTTIPPSSLTALA
jgi:hypothetical protein